MNDHAIPTAGDNCTSCGARLHFLLDFKGEYLHGNMAVLSAEDEDTALQVRRVEPGLYEPWGTEQLDAAWAFVNNCHAPDCQWVAEALSPDRVSGLESRFARGT